MITERAQKILNAAIQEFIETGEPVSSAQLYENHDFGIRPAMIRCELEELAELGFLEHPYHSAGRIPSDKGYELFARSIMNQPAVLPSTEEKKISSLFEGQSWDEFLHKLSETLGILGVADNEEQTYKSGIENLIDNLEWETPDEIKRIIRDFVEIEEHICEARALIEQTPDIFIGKRNVITKSNNLAVIGGSYEVDGGRITILAIGPKRMDYKKAVKIFKNLKKKASKNKN